MKISRIFTSSLFFLSGVMVVLISLVSVNQVNSYEGTQVSKRTFYVGQRILPDHILYPMVAVADRALLIVAPTQEKIKLQLAYGRIRFTYARALLRKGEVEMALAALTKSQKYHSLAAQQFLSKFEAEPFPSELKQTTIDHLQQNIEQSKQLTLQFSPDQTSLIDQLNQHNQALLQKLQEI